MSEEFSILVVDDNGASRKELVRVVRGLHEQVFEASTLAEALEVFRRERPAIVVADLDMPTISAAALARTLQADDPRVLLAVVSSFENRSKVFEVLRAGAGDVLQKPITESELQVTLSRFLSLISRRESRVLRPDVLRSARAELVLESRERSIAPAVAFVSQLLSGFVQESETIRIELALQEVLRNAYEHGNLGLSKEEKMTLLEEDRLEEVLGIRAKHAREHGKMIVVGVKVQADRFECTVRDDGNGFDWQAARNAPRPGKMSTELSGRGVMLIDQVFDEVIYNDTGNEIRLRKKLS